MLALGGRIEQESDGLGPTGGGSRFPQNCSLETGIWALEGVLGTAPESERALVRILKICKLCLRSIRLDKVYHGRYGDGG